MLNLAKQLEKYLERDGFAYNIELNVEDAIEFAGHVALRGVSNTKDALEDILEIFKENDVDIEVVIFQNRPRTVSAIGLEFGPLRSFRKEAALYHTLEDWAITYLGASGIVIESSSRTFVVWDKE